MTEVSQRSCDNSVLSLSERKEDVLIQPPDWVAEGPGFLSLSGDGRPSGFFEASCIMTNVLDTDHLHPA